MLKFSQYVLLRESEEEYISSRVSGMIQGLQSLQVNLPKFAHNYPQWSQAYRELESEMSRIFRGELGRLVSRDALTNISSAFESGWHDQVPKYIQIAIADLKKADAAIPQRSAFSDDDE